MSGSVHICETCLSTALVLSLVVPGDECRLCGLKPDPKALSRKDVRALVREAKLKGKSTEQR